MSVCKINNEYEDTISLRGLLFHIMYHWRSLLVMTLIGAILLGVYVWIRNQDAKTEANNQSEETATMIKDYYDTSSYLYQRMLEENKEYSDKSILMNINPYKEWQAKTVYSVVLDNNADVREQSVDPAVNIAAAYASLLDIDDAIKSLFPDYENKYISELISINAIEGTGTFQVNAIGQTEDNARNMQEHLEKKIAATSQGDIQSLGKHHIVKLFSETNQIIDDLTGSKQISTARNIAAYQKAITDNDTAISKIATSSGNKANKKSVRKYIIIGALLGFLVCIGFYTITYIMSGKMHDPEIIKQKYGIPLYGEFFHSEARHPGKGIDGMIEKWEQRKDQADKDIIYSNICALIQEHAGSKNVLLTGTISQSRIKEVRDNLTDRLGETCTLSEEGNFLDNYRAITEVCNAQAIILVEEKNISRLDEINHMIEKLIISEANVVGAIIL